MQNTTSSRIAALPLMQGVMAALTQTGIVKIGNDPGESGYIVREFMRGNTEPLENIIYDPTLPSAYLPIVSELKKYL